MTTPPRRHGFVGRCFTGDALPSLPSPRRLFSLIINFHFFARLIFVIGDVEELSLAGLAAPPVCSIPSIAFNNTAPALQDGDLTVAGLAGEPESLLIVCALLFCRTSVFPR